MCFQNFIKIYISFGSLLLAHAQVGYGLVQIRNAMVPAPSMGKVISQHSMARDILIMEAVNTS